MAAAPRGHGSVPSTGGDGTNGSRRSGPAPQRSGGAKGRCPPPRQRGRRGLRGPRAGRWLPPGAAHSYPVSQGGAAGCGVPRPRALAAPRRDSQRRAPLRSRLLFACRGCEWRARPAGPWHGGGVSAPSAGRARRRRSLKPHWGAARAERPLRFARLLGECGAVGDEGGLAGRGIPHPARAVPAPPRDRHRAAPPGRERPSAAPGAGASPEAGAAPEPVFGCWELGDLRAFGCRWRCAFAAGFS